MPREPPEKITSSGVVIAEEMDEPVEDVKFETVVEDLHPSDEGMGPLGGSQVVADIKSLDASDLSW